MPATVITPNTEYGWPSVRISDQENWNWTVDVGAAAAGRVIVLIIATRGLDTLTDVVLDPGGTYATTATVVYPLTGQNEWDRNKMACVSLEVPDGASGTLPLVARSPQAYSTMITYGGLLSDVDMSTLVFDARVDDSDPMHDPLNLGSSVPAGQHLFVMNPAYFPLNGAWRNIPDNPPWVTNILDEIVRSYNGFVASTIGGDYSDIGVSNLDHWDSSNNRGNALMLAGFRVSPASTTPPVRNVTMVGLTNTSTFGTPFVQRGAVTVRPSPLVNTRSFGTPVVSRGAVTVRPVGFTNAQSFGTAVVTRGAPQPQNVQPVGLTNSSLIGSPTVTVGGVTVQVVGLANSQSFGTLVASPGAVTVGAVSFVNESAFGEPQLNLHVTMEGLVNESAFGTSTFTLSAIMQGFENSQSFGTPTLLPGPVSVEPEGLINESLFGTFAVSNPTTVEVASGSATLSGAIPSVTVTNHVHVTVEAGRAVLVSTTVFVAGTVVDTPVIVEAGAMELIGSQGYAFVSSGTPAHRTAVVPAEVRDAHVPAELRLARVVAQSRMV